eukprot:1139524-Pelagomonas_calceolata.AAC.13
MPCIVHTASCLQPKPVIYHTVTNASLPRQQRGIHDVVAGKQERHQRSTLTDAFAAKATRGHS